MVILWVVAPLLLLYKSPADAARVVFLLEQKVVAPEMVGVGGAALTVILVGELVAVHPLALVTVTV